MDALEAGRPPAGILQREVDMTRCEALMEKGRATGVQKSPTAMLVRAAAIVLARNPELLRMVVGKRAYRYNRADICVSVAGRSATAPTVILQNANEKTWMAIAAELQQLASKARQASRRGKSPFSRWGWLVPFSSARRAVARWGARIPAVRDRLLGSLQVTTLPGLDAGGALQFGTPAILSVSGTQDRVCAVAGRPVVRPSAILCCSFNHRVWDESRAARFLRDVAEVLEGDALGLDLPERQCDT
jgi:pyruvate/2-oxoglutarate dehydrogenase complex dihydrolipoamide acyltransferase (E2) component